MAEQNTGGFHQRYDLASERESFPSRREPARHQTAALTELRRWFESDPSPAGAVLVLPTGAGKTFVTVRFLCTGPLTKGYKVLWLAHTHHLLEQAFHCFRLPDSERLRQAGSELSLIGEPRSSLSVRVVSGTSGHFPVSRIKPDDDVVIATLQTVSRAYLDPRQTGLKGFLDSADGRLLIVFDEAHHSPAPTYRRLLTDLREAYPGSRLLGLTATPTYSDEKKRGWLARLFPQGIVAQSTPSELAADNILARPRFEEPATHFTPEVSDREYEKWLGDYRDIPENIIEQLAKSRERNALIAETYIRNRERYGKTLIFADRWFQCEQISEMLRSRGVSTGAVYSHVDADPGGVEERNRRTRDENAKALEAFRRGEIEVLLNVRMLTEGTDVPDVQTVFLTRQTTSRILLTQMVGRALRGPRFGGTAEAYIVSFIDDWKKAVNWAGYDQLAEGMADEALPEYGKRPPLRMISIDLVRRLVRQLDSGLTVAPGPFLSFVPVGWYRAEFEAAVEDDIESRRIMVMVFEGEKECYERFLVEAGAADLEGLESESADIEDFRSRIEGWETRFFSSAGEGVGGDRTTNLFHLARHLAQSEGEPPRFYPFDDRENHDLDRIAQQFIDKDLGPRSVDDSLRTEYGRKDRYWRVIYPSYELFKSQYDACSNRLIFASKEGRGDGDRVPAIAPTGDALPEREPSKQIKDQVISRDGSRCLCCGEDSKRSLQVDHVAPSYYGGDNSLDNLQTLCRTCNLDKSINTQDFRVQRTLLTSPPERFEHFKPPLNAKSPKEWEKWLRRSINFFYRCAAVSKVRIGSRGDSAYRWSVELYQGNDHSWLEPHIPELVKRVNEAKSRDKLGEISSIAVSAPEDGD